MSDAIVVVDDQNRVVDVNPAAERILDFTVPAVIGRPLVQVSSRLAEVVALASDSEGDFQTEFDLWAGTAFYSYDVRISPLRRVHGLLTGRLISLRNVTEQRRREQQLDVLNRMLRHNLRNGLTIVRGNALLLKEEVTERDLKQRIETIETTVEKMITRSEKVKNIANTSDLKTYGPVDIAEELTDLIAAKRRVHPKARITTDCPGQAWVAAGPAAITALDEVITNAIKHHDGAMPTVHIAVATGKPNHETVEIRVTDNGPGIPDREVNPILQGRETPLDHSTGVGLWLVTWIVRELDGDIEFPETDGGSAVVIYLPCGSEAINTSF